MKKILKRGLIILAGLVALLSAGIIFGNPVCILLENDQPSKSIGTTANGRLENGKRQPNWGDNFVCYSYVGTMLGRNCVHGKVREVVLETYAELKEKYPEKEFVYGETGWPSGGSFAPHKTHQNGLCVDFMVPVKDSEGNSVPLPTWVFNKGGYAIQFDLKGRYKDYQIDYQAMAAHIDILVQTARKKGLRVRRVIFDPKLQPYLFQTRTGRSLKGRVYFSKHRSWVRHDEHYHVDFAL